ncbi:MAG TPA: alkaline phosphatase family protein [Trebonia sp.]
MRAGHPGRVTDDQARLLDKATEAAASGASLSDVKHIVILTQENRSFDHYFGTLSGVRGFSDPNVPHQTVGGTRYPVFDQFGYKPGTGVDAALDHTSTLRFIESRFGVSVPNLSAWRRGATGDFTRALDLAKPPVTKVPALPATSLIGNTTVVEEAVLNALTGTLDVGIDYPLPTSNHMPSQETTPARPPVP